MKKTLLSLIFLCLVSTVFAQKRNPIDDRFNFVPGKIIVKLKDNVDTKTTYNAKGKGTSQVNIGELLGIESKVKTTTILFSEKSVTRSLIRKKSSIKDPRLPNPHTLKNTFILELTNTTENVLSLIEELNKNDKVEYAEPDYNLSVNDFTIDSEIIYPATTIKTTSVSNTPDDPLYSQQTNITSVKIDSVWSKYTTGDGNQIIAILDTGVDYNHPDLEANIWTNEAELNGVEGFDDDGNGYIDDIRGWDFINVDNAPLDDNMHGTHVAGIAGAVGNNGIGIAGAAWNVKLMPIKVFQSNGVGNASTIAEGVTYASENGATILNMSFGTYAESSTMRNALENAYATSVLVASAGNDGICIGPGKCPDNQPSLPLYPGAYTYVLGVQDAAGYSNYDQDGPIFSGYSNLLNYETKAPGTGIMSTVPNGGYRTLTGTSMSSPLLAGGVALYLQQNPDDSKELLFGNLINTSATYVDIIAAIEVTPTPQLKVLSAMVLDTINGQNGNKFIESNETIEILPLIKNYWGPTDDVRVGIEFAEFEDQTKATILESEIAIGSITAYATLQDLTKSLKIQIADNVANNVNIKFNLKVWSGPDKEYLTSTEYVINVKNSILLYGLKSEDLTLYPNKEYLVSDNLAFTNNATLLIKPGVTLKFSDNKLISFKGQSRILAVGTKDSLINFIPENNSWGGMTYSSDGVNSEIKFSKFRGVSNNYGIKGNVNLEITNAIIEDFNTFYTPVTAVHVSKTNIVNNLFAFYTSDLSHSNVIDNKNTFLQPNQGGVNREYCCHGFYSPNPSVVNGNNIFNNEVSLSANNDQTYIIDSVYLGSTIEETIRKTNWDFLNRSMDKDGLLDFTSLRTIPYELAPGIVWKVLVNGKDAQDEYELMDPVGVGTHTFDIYFNREMDITKPPQISYGVREPYVQKIISEEGSWSVDSKIYSVTHEVKIGVADGINRIRVQGARDLDYFDIPIEDYRFNMLVQSAGSASTGFAATPGLGEITLDWEAPNAALLEDVLGYNMYRYQAITDSTFTASAKINNALITDPQLVDFNVEEGIKYYYQYKILRTSFEETDFSTTVTTQALTSILGDSNGDFSVNVMDLVQVVDYILGNNPTPFILIAADVNNDDAINVLDIVGTVDIILNPTSGKTSARGGNSINYYSSTIIGDATFYWEENDLYVESEHEITGIQLAFDKDFKYNLSMDLPKFEWLNYEQEGSKVTMMYSFGDVRLPAGKTKLLTKTSSEEISFNIDKAVVAAPNGGKLNVLYKDNVISDIKSPVQSDTPNLVLIGPNPTNGILNIYYYLPEQMDKVVVSAYNLLGSRVWSNDAYKNTSGSASAVADLSSLTPGVYIVVIDVIRNGELKRREAKQIILNK